MNEFERGITPQFFKKCLYGTPLTFIYPSDFRRATYSPFEFLNTAYSPPILQYIQIIIISYSILLHSIFYIDALSNYSNDYLWNRKYQIRFVKFKKANKPFPLDCLNSALLILAKWFMYSLPMLWSVLS